MNSKKNRVANLLAAVPALLAMSVLGVSANAQEQEDAIEEIVVSAKFKKSVISAIEQKRLADTQIEAIGLEDIGVLPAVLDRRRHCDIALASPEREPTRARSASYLSAAPRILRLAH